MSKLSFTMVRVCAIIGCSNSTRQLDAWYSRLCDVHGQKNGSCICHPPFTLFPFPSDKEQPEKRKHWIEIVNRKNKDGWNWQPKSYDRICSRHFKEGEPTDSWPDPTENAGYRRPSSASKSPRQPPKERPPHPQVLQEAKAKSKSKRDLPSTSSSVEDGDILEHAEDEIDTAPMQKTFQDLNDHDYVKSPSKRECVQCTGKEEHVRNLDTIIMKLRNKLREQEAKSKHQHPVNIVTKSDETVNMYTCISSKEKLESLHSFLEPKAKKMRYRKGEKSSPHSSPSSSPRQSPISSPVSSPRQAGEHSTQKNKAHQDL